MNGAPENHALPVEQLLAALCPDARALYPLFRTEVSDDMLREIAEADYGSDRYYPLLVKIRAAGIAESLACWDLQEVLQLIRWSEPELSNWKPGSTGTRGHWMRLFACTALVQLGATEAGRDMFSSETDTLAQLVMSALELGKSVSHRATSLLAWRYLASPGQQEVAPFLAFAILLLAVHGRMGDGAWRQRLALWVEEEEDRARQPHSESDWLFGLNPWTQREDVWRTLADRILVHPDKAHPPEADEELRLIGAMVPLVKPC